jgi:uncharacterized membrane protein (DUF485 family)
MSDPGTPHVQPDLPKPSKLGLALFAFYCLVYTGFIGVAVFDIGRFRTEVFAGVNLAIVWGMALIGGALLLALIYLLLDRIEEDKP